MELGGRALTIIQTEHCCAHSVQFFFKFVQFCLFVFHFVQLYFWYFPRDISCSLIRLQQPTDVSWSNIFLPGTTVWQPKRAEDLIFLFGQIHFLFGQIHFEIRTTSFFLIWTKLVQYNLVAREAAEPSDSQKGHKSYAIGFHFAVWTNTFFILTHLFSN